MISADLLLKPEIKATKNRTHETVYSILILISFGHFINDLLQGIISSIYPLLRGSYGLSFSQIGLITFGFQFTASILQPIVGYYTDKFPKPNLLVYGMLFSTIGVIALSYADNFYLILVSSMIIGIGSAIFHPESCRISNLASGGKLGLAQSIFQVGGNLGAALAPLAIALIIVPNSQKYILWFLIASTLGLGILTQIAYWYKHHLINRNKQKVIIEKKHLLTKSK